LYKSGLSMRAIAAQYAAAGNEGMSASTVKRILADNDVPMRRVGRRPLELPPSERAAIARAYLSGLNSFEVAAQFHHGHVVIREALIDAGAMRMPVGAHHKATRVGPGRKSPRASSAELTSPAERLPTEKP